MSARAVATWLAGALVELACLLLPEERRHWAQAMRAEVAHLSGHAALGWATGCLTTAIKQRLFPMQTGTLRISRWILLLELVACFLPLTMGWFDAVAGESGVIRLNGELIEKYFLDTPHDTLILAMMFGGAVIGVTGPIGLLLGLRAAFTGRCLRSRALGVAMIAGATVYAAGQIALLMLYGPGAYAVTFGALVLFLFLPVAGTLHLMYLAKPAVATPSVAAA